MTRSFFHPGNLHSTTATSGTSSGSISPADTPMLPALSPSSSVATFMIGSSSDSSGANTPNRKYDQQFSSARTRSKSNESGTVRSRRNRSRSESKSSDSFRKSPGLYKQILGFFFFDRGGGGGVGWGRGARATRIT